MLLSSKISDRERNKKSRWLDTSHEVGLQSRPGDLYQAEKRLGTHLFALGQAGKIGD